MIVIGPVRVPHRREEGLRAMQSTCRLTPLSLSSPLHCFQLRCTASATPVMAEMQFHSKTESTSAPPKARVVVARMCVSTPTAVPLAQAQLNKTQAEKHDDTSSVTSSSAASSTDAPSGKTGLAFVAQKLITKEDPFMIHKVTGIFALVSFFYRYVVKLLRTGTLGFTGSRFDWVTMSMHMILSASAIQFRVPSQRQPRRPTMIWHEYRVHAILFTVRCCFVYALGFWAPKAGAAVRFATTMVMHVMVDRVTAIHGKENETTIRGRGNTVNSFVTKMRRGYSFYQFVAVASHLTASPRAMDMGYNTIIAIQSCEAGVLIPWPLGCSLPIPCHQSPRAPLNQTSHGRTLPPQVCLPHDTQSQRPSHVADPLQAVLAGAVDLGRVHLRRVRIRLRREVPPHVFRHGRGVVQDAHARGEQVRDMVALRAEHGVLSRWRDGNRAESALLVWNLMCAGRGLIATGGGVPPLLCMRQWQHFAGLCLCTIKAAQPERRDLGRTEDGAEGQRGVHQVASDGCRFHFASVTSLSGQKCDGRVGSFKTVIGHTHAVTRGVAGPPPRPVAYLVAPI